MRYCPEAQNIFCKYYSGELDQDMNNDLFQKALENTKNFYQLINFENFKNDTLKLIDNFNIKNIEVPHINQSSNKKEITEDERKIIEFYNYFDLKFYKIIKSKN